VRRAAFDQFLDFIAEGFFRITQFESAIEVQDGGVTCFANADIHMSLTAMCKANRIVAVNQGFEAQEIRAQSGAKFVPGLAPRLATLGT